MQSLNWEKIATVLRFQSIYYYYLFLFCYFDSISKQVTIKLLANFLIVESVIRTQIHVNPLLSDTRQLVGVQYTLVGIPETLKVSQFPCNSNHPMRRDVISPRNIHCQGHYS